MTKKTTNKSLKTHPNDNKTPLHSQDVVKTEQESHKPITPLCRECIEADGRRLYQIKRDQFAAIYVKKRGNTINGYEVFRIKILKPCIVNGKEYGWREKYPGNNDFGRIAKSCVSLESAEDWFYHFSLTEMQSRIKAENIHN